MDSTTNGDYFSSTNRHLQTPFASSGSERQLPILRPTLDNYAPSDEIHQLSERHNESSPTSTKKPKHKRVRMLLGFHAINMCLGALAWVPAVLLTLVSIPLWCMRTSAEDGGEGGCFARIARWLADTDIRLANYAVPFALKQHEPILRSQRLDAGVGPAVAKVFLYFSTVKVLTTFLSFIAIYGTIGTIVVAFASGGTKVGIPGVSTSFSESPTEYILLVVARLLIGCVSVLFTAPRSLMATRFFCGMRIEEQQQQQQQVERVAGCVA